MYESERYLNRRKGEVERFLFNNWAGYGREFNFEHVLPVVIIEKDSKGKYSLTPTFEVEKEPLVESNIYGQGVGYNRDHFLVIGSPSNLALLSDNLDVQRWYADFVNPAGISRPQLRMSVIDLFNLLYRNPPLFKTEFFNFGQMTDLKNQTKSQVMLVGFTEESETLAKIQAMEWMKKLSDEKIATLKNQKSVGLLVSSNYY